MCLFETVVGWRYFRVDTQPLSDGWRLWVYKMNYDGPHVAIHFGPIVIGWGAL